MWDCEFHDDPTGAEEHHYRWHHFNDTHTQVPGDFDASAAGEWMTQQSHHNDVWERHAGALAVSYLPYGGGHHSSGHPIADPSMQQQTPQYPRTHYGFPPYQMHPNVMWPPPEPSARDRGESLPPLRHSPRRRAPQSSQQVPTERAGEVTIGERLRLVEEFERRKKFGERITISRFEREKGLKPGQFKQWRHKLKKQPAPGKKAIDTNKKRNRQPKYHQIEDVMQQWMANHADPMSVPPKAIRVRRQWLLGEPQLDQGLRCGVSKM
ncbi:unnamed protein product [Vitrella brassicaformis CCMP3155]|uniref:Uncharacterized protein n=1 Tax=Vitrella brassicaformis (strain CCMP3155) TaxID=1169540 RepID=A0A0G4GFE4_VITBC|nr:unnamed protein product [Vitrella brassicaformis CCMP3155]|eukprot:CEM27935.1 unnamed protein product [Vitrella brassicaformis CCMP3155]